MIALRSTAEDNVTTASTSVSPTAPSGAASGDVLILDVVISHNNNNAAMTIGNDGTNGAWTVYSAPNPTFGTVIINRFILACATGAPDSSWTVSWNGSYSVIHSWGISAWTGVDTSDPENQTTTVNASQNNAPTATGVTTDAAGCMIVHGVGVDRRSLATIPDTTLFDIAPDSSADIAFGSGYVLQASAGATGDAAYANVAGISDQWGAVLTALNPDPGGGGGDDPTPDRGLSRIHDGVVAGISAGLGGMIQTCSGLMVPRRLAA